MDGLTFISNMTSALAWPVVIAGIAVYFRRELRLIASTLKKLKLGPMEAEMFEEDARVVKAKAVSLGEVQIAPASDADRGAGLPSGAGSDVDDKLLEILDRNAGHYGNYRFAVVRVWSAVEDSLRSRADHLHLSGKVPVVSMLLELERKGVLSSEERNLLRKMYDMRHAANQGYMPVSYEAAFDYVVAASAILRRLGWAKTPGRADDLRAGSLGVEVTD